MSEPAAPAAAARPSRWTAPFDAPFGRGATFLLAAFVVVAAGSLAYQAAFARALDGSDVRAFDASLGLALVAAIPIGAAQIVVVRHLTSVRGSCRWASAAARLGVLAGGAGAVAAIAALSRVDGLGAGPLLVLLLAANVGVSAALVLPRGVLLVDGELAAVGWAGLAGIGARLALAVTVIALGGGVPGALAVLLVSSLVSGAVLVARAGRGTGAGARRPLVIPWRTFVGPGLAFAGLALLVVVEALLARRYLRLGSQTDVRTATDLAKTTLLVPQAMVLVAMACFARGGRAAVDGLKFALRVVAGVAIVVTPLLAIGAQPASEYLLGRPSAVPTGLVLLLGAASSMVGLMCLLVTYDVMRERSDLTTVWLAVGLTVAAAVLSHTSSATLAITFLLIVLAALARLLAGPALVGPAARWDGRERRRPPSRDDLDLTVVVPFHNPGPHLREHVLELVDTLAAEQVRFEIVAVSDGSTDGSEDLVTDLAPLGVRTVVFDRNQGKGAALRAGLASARGHHLGFIDADGDIPPAQWHHFLELMRMYDADMVVGSKRHPLSRVQYPPVRRAYSKAYQALVHALFRIDVADTQTGIKLFRREVLGDVLPLVVERGFVFDLELLVVARRRGWRRVLEAPVTVQHHFTSTISPRAVGRMLVETLRLAGRVHVLRSYEVADADRAPRVDALTRRPA